mmetsp:Transcript_11254/g.31134  ORF Transcript_11254/g.31134 Transcript_11254/m.31134 type:complete len:215 (-) Transcript_11254:740-1384(-)
MLCRCCGLNSIRFFLLNLTATATANMIVIVTATHTNYMIVHRLRGHHRNTVPITSRHPDADRIVQGIHGQARRRRQDRRGKQPHQEVQDPHADSLRQVRRSVQRRQDIVVAWPGGCCQGNHAGQYRQHAQEHGKGREPGGEVRPAQRAGIRLQEAINRPPQADAMEELEDDTHARWICPPHRPCRRRPDHRSCQEVVRLGTVFARRISASRVQT